jgi:MarR family transcriptional regulator, organic hydroperoxide resistance regulator
VNLPLGSTLEFLRLIWAVDHGLHRASGRMESSLGITGPQRFALRLVGRFPGVTCGQIADALEVHPSTVTGILNRLERRGLLTRRADARDSRRRVLMLTARGLALNVDPAGTIEGAVERVLKKLPPEQLASAATVLEAIASALAQAAPDAPRRKRRSSSPAPNAAAGLPVAVTQSV